MRSRKNNYYSHICRVVLCWNCPVRELTELAFFPEYRQPNLCDVQLVSRHQQGPLWKGLKISISVIFLSTAPITDMNCTVQFATCFPNQYLSWSLRRGIATRSNKISSASSSTPYFSFRICFRVLKGLYVLDSFDILLETQSTAWPDSVQIKVQHKINREQFNKKLIYFWVKTPNVRNCY